MNVKRKFRVKGGGYERRSFWEFLLGIEEGAFVLEKTWGGIRKILHFRMLNCEACKR